MKETIQETDFTAPYFNQDGSIKENTEAKKRNFIFNLKTLFASSIPVESNTIEKTILEQASKTTQKKTINGYFDSDLKVIVLGENLNNGTLPHEMAHFFLDRTFELWRDNQGTKEFRNYFDRIAESLEISKKQVIKC